MSMKKIAEKAGVSVATVSKAFQYSKDISEETRRKIFATAKELGVFEKYAEKKYPKKVIAVICPEIRGGYYNGVLQILREKISRRGWIMIASITGFDQAAVEELYEYHTKYQKADGVLMMYARVNPDNPMLVPTVYMGYEGKADSVGSGIMESFDDVVQMCRENGHQKIAFLGEQLTLRKQMSFQKAMEKEGLWVYRDMMIASKLRFEAAGRDGVQKLLAIGRIPDAIVAAYDQIAIGAIQALRENGLSVPEDVSVIGMNDIEACTYLETPLTTVKTDIDDLCEKSLDLLCRKMENRYYSSKERVTAKSRLIQRNSVQKK